MSDRNDEEDSVPVPRKAKNTLGPVGRAVQANVTRLRSVRGLTQKALCDAMATAGRPVPLLAIHRIESGVRRVDADDLVALAFALKVTVQQLLESTAGCDVCQGAPPLGFACTKCWGAA